MAPRFSRRRRDVTPDTSAVSAASAAPSPTPRGGSPEPVAVSASEPDAALTTVDPALFEKARTHWSAQIGELSDFSTLTDITRLEGAIIDITHAHPSGIAQLYAGRATRLSSLVRDPSALASARETARATLARAAEYALRFGAAPVYLALGTAQWAEVATDGDVRLVTAPLLLRPASLKELSESDLELTLSPGIEINPEFVEAIRAAGSTADVAAIAAMSVTEHGFSPRSTLAQLAQLGAGHLADFEMSEKLYVGPFVHPGKTLQDDLDAVADYWPDHHIVRALAGDLEVKRHLAVDLPERQLTDRTPDAERGVGDLDPQQQAILDHVVAGYDLILDARPGADVPAMLTAILADAAASGRSVVYVAGTRRAGRAVVAELEEQGLGDMVLDLQDVAWRSQAPVAIRESLRPSTDTVDEDAVFALRADLMKTRAQIEEYTRALHEHRESWAVGSDHEALTAYDALQGLADLTSGPDAPRTTVRFDEETTRGLTPEIRADAVTKLDGLARLGAFTLRPSDTPWYGTKLTDPDAVTGVLEATQALGEDVLPQVIGDVGRVARETGLIRAVTLADWCEQLEMLNGIRESLDVFIPVIFERTPGEMVIATAPKKWRKDRDLPMSWATRRRLTKQAKDMVRPGRPVEDLHGALATIKTQRDVWRRHCPSGGWPTLPQGLGDLERTAADAVSWIEKLEGVFDDDPMTMPLEELRDWMLALGSDPSALRFIPEINTLAVELRALGLGAFIEDMSERRIESAALESELELAWWASVLESIVRSDSNLAQYDGATLNDVASSFRALDRAQVATLPGPVRRAAARRLARTVVADKAAAQDLWREVANGHAADVKSLRARFGALVTAARPIWVVPALQVGQVLPPSRDIDLMIIDGAQNLPTGALVGAISRAAQTMFVGDLSRHASGVIDELNGTVPSVALPTDRGQREEHIASFLAGHGYGTLGTVPARPSPSRIRLHTVNGIGTPVLGAVAVEGVEAEVQRVVELAHEHVSAGEEIGIISLSAIAARRIADAVALDPTLAAADIPVVDVEHAAGLSRDTVILSVGFAKTPHGRVLHRFGPISTPEGLPLMIDALDAVRHNLEVVTCIAPEELDGDRLTHAGTKLLDALLDFASDSPAGPGSSKARSEPQAGEADRLLDDLGRRLTERGLTVAPQYGFDDGMRLPLAVGHPDCPGELVVAVMTDNVQYVSEPSLRRRDRLWVERLERHGWNVHFAYSTAVFMDPVAEADIIEAKVRALIPETPSVPRPVAKAPSRAATSVPAGAQDVGSGAERAQGPNRDAVSDLPPGPPETTEDRSIDDSPEPPTPDAGDEASSTSGDTGAETTDLAETHGSRPPEPPDDSNTESPSGSASSPESSFYEEQALAEIEGHGFFSTDIPDRRRRKRATPEPSAASTEEAVTSPDEPEAIQGSLFPPVFPKRDFRSYSDDELDEIAAECVRNGMSEEELVTAMREHLGVTRRGKSVDSVLHRAAARRLAQ